MWIPQKIPFNAATISEVNSTAIDLFFTLTFMAKETQDYAPLQKRVEIHLRWLIVHVLDLAFQLDNLPTHELGVVQRGKVSVVVMDSRLSSVPSHVKFSRIFQSVN